MTTTVRFLLKKFESLNSSDFLTELGNVANIRGLDFVFDGDTKKFSIMLRGNEKVKVTVETYPDYVKLIYPNKDSEILQGKSYDLIDVILLKAKEHLL